MARSLNTELHLFLSDQQIPFQDPYVEDLIFGFLDQHRPGTVHLLGDLVDFYSISSHRRDPRRRFQLQDEADKAHAYIASIRTILGKRAIIKYSEGNHENRAQRHLWSEAPDLADLRALQLPELLGLDDLGVQWFPEFEPYKEGHLWVRHGHICRKHSAYTARAAVEEAGSPIIQGHTHRMGAHYVTKYSGVIAGWENGCLCKIDPSIHRYTKGPPNWQQGFSVAQFHNELFQMEQVIILGKGRQAGYLFHGYWHGVT